MSVQEFSEQHFNQVIDRRNAYSVKYDMSGHGKPIDALPLWVADMDFRSPPCVTDAMIQQCRHGIFGYSDIDDSYFHAVKGWFLRRFSWEVKRDWLVVTTGVSSAVHTAIRALSEPGDAVLIQEPVYHPFASAIRGNNRKPIVNELVYLNNRYSIDFDDFKEKIEKNNVKLFILCNPHNPVGRVWTKSELYRMGEICAQNNVVVISDEIHQDFIYEGHKHRVFEMQDPSFRNMTITCTAPTKTFNLAGISISNIFIANPYIRRKFLAELSLSGIEFPNIMGIVACKSAYESGEEWLNGLLEYLSGNIEYLREFIAGALPRVRLVEPEGTYLAWLNFNKLEFVRRNLCEVVLNKGKLWLIDGTVFGSGGEGFLRMNIACPRIVLWEAMKRLEKAVRSLKK
ncbi:MAG: pyridoxal phosphate-dependent aminotransferase [Oscillospiraceae bacterium]|nr:pyridoxal phosphate-dependent aminotransferase [Oscillospiraceae bacterium]